LWAFARYQTDLLTQVAGHIFVLFVFGVAAAEVAVGLGIIVVIFRLRESIDVDEVSLLRGVRAAALGTRASPPATQVRGSRACRNAGVPAPLRR
jgi:hypothetical protein